MNAASVFVALISVGLCFFSLWLLRQVARNLDEVAETLAESKRLNDETVVWWRAVESWDGQDVRELVALLSALENTRNL